MLTPEDFAQIQSDVAQVIADNDVSITLRRNGATFGPYLVRVEMAGRAQAQRRQGPVSEETQNRAVVISQDEGFAPQVGDEFNAHGYLFEITAVLPNTQPGRMAQAIIIQ